ncbi:MAG: ATP-dependent DNA helicase RecG [Bacilli bacterium]|nr:ATP-dependent DNA helicase RecG [Bacilli bacterium]
MGDVVLGASKKENESLLKMGIVNDEDLLRHLPRRYEDFSLTPKEKMYSFASGQKAVFYGTLTQNIKVSRFAKASKASFYFRTHYGIDVFFVAWNRMYLPKVIQQGEFYTLQGSYDEKNHCFNLLSVKKGRVVDTLIPVYSLPDEFPEHRFIRLVDLALQRKVGEILPVALLDKHNLPSLNDAFSLCHHPHSYEELSLGVRYFKYEEALLFSLRNVLIKKENQSISKTSSRPCDKASLERFIATLPYPLTKDQRTALDEIVSDLDKPHVMNRLLQGDVGTGKTLVAALAMYANYTRVKQSALMAPTEALARQHANTLRKLYRGKLNVVLLLGQTPASERRQILASLRDGTIDVLVGTHALFSQDVHYASLGLVIIDEQHKFGVNQRVALLGKGEEADLLLMSATPIPRTLALSLYGDMDVSTLEVFPSAKRSVKTILVRPKDPRIKRSVDWTLKNDGQIYVVAPQIEEDERPGFLSVNKLFAGYEKFYPGQCVLLHGKMKPEEKDDALTQFASGNKKILVATSVIEVGIDVPKARLLVVYESSHFSLSSLHQLRGRVGRDGRDAYCILINAEEDEETLQKLNVLTQTGDGFEISKADLSMRGFGELTGVKQSGMLDLRFASLVDDYQMFVEAQKEAKAIAENPLDKGNAYLLSLAKKATVIRG